MTSKLKSIMEQAEVPIMEEDIVLYLGASHGVTANIIAGIVGEKGFVFCLDLSYDTMPELLKLCEKNRNMCPLLFDASQPGQYKERVTEVDLIYQDLAQKSQAGILKRNAEMFLREGGHFILIIKTQSIDTVKSPEEVLKEVKEELKEFEIKTIDINRTHAKHYAIIGKK